MPTRVFINYRRGAGQASAGRLYDRLNHHFKSNEVFMDVARIPPGEDFAKVLIKQVAECEAFIIVIGPGWLEFMNEHRTRRAEDPGDWVRLEIEAALNRKILIVPVLVDGAGMPGADDLPESIKALARRHAMTLAYYRFNSDADELAQSLKVALRRDRRPFRQEGLDPSPVNREGNWANSFFSFGGRISRKRYWAAMATIFLLGLILDGLLLPILGGSLRTYFLSSPEDTPLQQRLITFVATLPLWWPLLAIIRKRIRDFGQGWVIFLALVISISVFSFLDIFALAAEKSVGAALSQISGMRDLSFILALLSLTLIVFIGSIKSGDNATN
jgi:uncharacterized membrane protein YhaH (DUF805 family)